MKYFLVVFITLFIFSSHSKTNCLIAENMFTEECEKQRKEEENKKQTGYLDEEYQIDKWVVNVLQHEGKDTSKWSIIASVNGKITNGDRFRIRILPTSIERCSVGNSITTFYTTKNNENIYNLSGVIHANFKDIKTGMQILFAKEFLMGHTVWMDLSWNKLKNIKDFFKDHKEVSLALLDSETIKVDDYFDIKENRFSLIGLNEALDRAESECRKIVEERDGKPIESFSEDYQKGLDYYKKGEYENAIEKWRSIAVKGHIRSQNNLGVMYAMGEGVEQNYKEAIKWYKLAAEKGNANAQNNLGYMYVKAEGVKQDYKEAVKWFRLAAAQGEIDGQTSLGTMYLNGHGVKKDNIKAYIWLSIASSKGHSTAKNNLNFLKKEMTKSQIKKAKELGIECSNNNYKNC